ncbi:hypothetical protein KC19_VG086400 [Ceratodon purpureus]|uniref:Uncharacterized protein n=1 Tax=Ceratodon purpureus TaxID=3225 RepID=A0A8T0HP08_CERPU|nr:hypothetical protein KC19_VG086400 [Ceratodon purpureus]
MPRANQVVEDSPSKGSAEDSQRKDQEEDEQDQLQPQDNGEESLKNYEKTSGAEDEEEEDKDLGETPLSEEAVKKHLTDLVSKEIVNSASRLEQLKWQPRSKSRLYIPLCRMISLPVVRLYLKNDVLTLMPYLTNSGLFIELWTMDRPEKAKENERGLVKPSPLL